MATRYQPATTVEKPLFSEAGNGIADAETVGGFKVHPAASLFPLLKGEAFDELVASIRQHGIRQPVVTLDGVLVDGRNRVRAVERLAEEGVTVDLAAIELSLPEGESVADWVRSTNIVRRHLTADVRAVIVSQLAPMIEAENAERQKHSQFQKGESGNPTGQATTESSSPVPRDRKAADARSTVGQVAEKANVSMHKARQATALQKAINDGTASPADADAVIAGKKPLRAVAPKPSRKKRSGKKAKGKAAPAAPTTDPVVADFGKYWPPAWAKFKGKFAVGDYPQVRKLVIAAVKAETTSQA
jgi:ParB-like chromosome segregation protein Spo0J